MKQRVLFLCNGNSCRSQMAEGFLRHLRGDEFEVFSAGIKPSLVNPYAIKVMAEIGIDISGQCSKNVTEFLGQPFDFVITLCDSAKQTCPFFPGKATRLHWDLLDPAEATGTEDEILAVFRKVRDQIKENILNELMK